MTVIIGMDPHKRSATIEVINECAQILTGTGDTRPATSSSMDGEEQGPPQQPHSVQVPGRSILRRTGSASRPSRYAVDLRSSPDPDPLPAFVRTYPGNRSKPVTNRAATALDTAPLLQE
jgi:hypothetical protein